MFQNSFAVRRRTSPHVRARAGGRYGDADGARMAQGEGRAAETAARDLHAREGPEADALRGIPNHLLRTIFTSQWVVRGTSGWVQSAHELTLSTLSYLKSLFVLAGMWKALNSLFKTLCFFVSFEEKKLKRTTIHAGGKRARQGAAGYEEKNRPTQENYRRRNRGS